MVIVTADHGEALGESGRFFHTFWLSEELLRIPLLIRYPDQRGAGSFDESTVQLTDILPIVAEALKLEVPLGVEGQLPGQRESVYEKLYRQQLAIMISPRRFDRAPEAAIQWPYKLVRSDRGARQLFRLEGGAQLPTELPEVADRLARQIETHCSSLVHAPISSPVVDDATLASLRELGYIE